MPEFKRVYLDSNALIEEEWPNLSPTLQNALSLANALGLEICLLDVVEQELEAHWSRDYFETRQKVLGNLSNLQKLGSRIGITTESKLPENAEVKKAYQKAVTELIEQFKLQKVKSRLRTTEELFHMAIGYRSPFRSRGKGRGRGEGFQDAVICLAAIDDLADSGEKVGALLSRDEVFDDETLDKLSKPKGVKLLLFKDVEELVATLRREVAAVIRAEWDADQQCAIEAVRKSLPLIQTFITENLEVPDSLGLFGGQITAIDKVDVLRVVAASTPPPWKRKPDQPVTFSVEVEVALHATVRRPLSALYERLLKVGTEGRQVPNPFLGDFGSGPQEQKKTLNRTVQIEVRAIIADGRYTNLQTISLKLKSS